MYIGGLLCRLTQQGKQVILGLELPITEQNQLANYLSSAGKNNDRDTLTQSEFWQRPSDRQDGRSSVAILNLIEQVRSMREHGAKISILAIDADPKDGILDRDEFMASTARRAIHSIEDPTFIALVGNIHGKKNLGTFFDRNYESFGYRLRELGPTTVNIKFISGTAWICNGKKCDIQPIFNTRKIDTSKIGFQLNRDDSTEYDLTLILTNSHASLPAKSIH
ncbi:hypothetical protein [Undibacterium danionis]|uniref:Uncharacterized protein n=1 Tax=Undibacterium danionis TaxID=1812100 RepID=A0ABV6IJR3_9BURK